jgi:hypothetical protein
MPSGKLTSNPLPPGPVLCCSSKVQGPLSQVLQLERDMANSPTLVTAGQLSCLPQMQRVEVGEELVSSLTTAWLLTICVCLSTGMQVYQRCWKQSDCHGEIIMDQLEETKLKFRCCQFNLCNKSDGSLGKTPLLGTSVLVAILNLCFLSHL